MRGSDTEEYGPKNDSKVCGGVDKTVEIALQCPIVYFFKARSHPRVSIRGEVSRLMEVVALVFAASVKTNHILKQIKHRNRRAGSLLNTGRISE